MPDVSFGNLLGVCVIAFVAPLLLGFVPRLRVPAVVVELVAGIVAGPSVLNWIHVDLPVSVLALIGLAFLLFLAGLEVQFESLRGRLLAIAGGGFAVSFALAVGVALVLKAGGLIETPVLVAVIFSATGLGVIVPVLKDAGEIASEFGQLVVAAASIADFGAVILLTLLFSREASATGTKAYLLGAFAVAVGIAAYGLARAGRSMRISDVLGRLQDTTAQIRVRGAVALLIGFTALAERLGLEAILGAFLAGVIVSIVDRDRFMTHELFRIKLEAMGFGFFIPVFFVTSGLRFDGSALIASASTIARIPLFLAALLAVRGLPALLYRGRLRGRQLWASALFQATSLSFIVAAAQIGMELGKLSEATGAALIAAGLLSVLVFPATALGLLRRGKEGVKAGPGSTPETGEGDARSPRPGSTLS